MNKDVREDMVSKSTDFIVKLSIPLIVAALGWGFSYINKLEERIYNLQATAVTDQKLQQTEARIMSYLDVRLGDLSTKMELIIKQNEAYRYYNNPYDNDKRR